MGKRITYENILPIMLNKYTGTDINYTKRLHIYSNLYNN